MVYQLKRTQTNKRPQAFWGSLIPSALSFVGGLITSSQQAKAQRRALEEQQRLAKQQLDINNQNQLASTLNNYALAQQSYDDKDYNLKYRIGGVKRLGSKNIMITDGGNAKRIGNNTYLLRGGSHEDINETGQTGIGINVGGNEIEAEGGEVAQRKGNSLRIYSAQPILGGISPAEAIMRGYNKDRVFNAQQRFKKNNGIKDDGSQQRNGGLTSKDRGSSKHPYPSVASKDFAGGNRSYPIPTKADAIDALRLAGLHGRSDVRSKVYNKYPELRKKARGGTKVDPYYDWARNTSSNLRISFIDPTYDYRTYYNSVTPYERNLIRFAPQGTHFTDIGKTPKHPTFSNESIYSNKKHTGGTWNGNVFVPNIWQFGNNGNKARNKYMNNSGEGYFNGRVNIFPKYRKKADFGTLTTPIDVKNSYIWDLLGGDRNSQSITADLKTILGLNDMYGAEDGHNSNLQYAGISIPYLSQIIKNSPRVAKSILRGTKLYGRDLKALVEAEVESAYNKVRRIFRGNNNAYSNITNTYSPYINTKFTGTPNSNIRPYVEPVNPVRGANTRRTYNTAKMQAANSELKMINNPEYAEQIVGNTVRNFSKSMSGKALQSAIGVSKYQPSNFVKYGIPAFASLAAYEYAGRETDNTKKSVSTQKDAKGKPISPYIARPQEPAKPQAKKVVSTRKNTTRTDTTKQVNKVVKRQVRTTPQYKGNTTRGNYQLHDGETKVINGVKYTRRGNTIINHKTNVGYIYDKNGNYTGQADYSKVGNFNQAFDAARAAGRNQFIYRAGKYNNYSTVKETNAKKEALNRRVGARRIAKRMGGLTNPPVERFKCGGRVRPKAEDGMLAPIYSYGTNRRRLPSFAPIDVTPRAIPNFKPISVPTNTKTPFDPNSVHFLGNQSTFKPATQDYIGLGIDTLAALGSGMFTRSAYNKMNFDYALPNYVDESPVAFDTTYHNEAQRANIERNRLNARNLIRGNTASAQTSLGRMQQSDVDAMMETNKLLDEKSNKEVELRNQNAANEQQVRARNAAARNQYYQNVAQIKNAAIEAKNNAELAKAQSIGADLSGLSQAWTNFAGSIEQRYDNRQKEAIIAATAKDPAVLSNAVQFGYNFSPEVLAAIYNSTDDDNLKSLALSQLSTKNRLRYGIR